MTGSLPHVGIVILNWNNYEDTAECLQSINNIEYNNYSIYVVDNGSSDQSGRRIDQDFDETEVIFNDENLGFSAGCNVGIKRAVADGCEYILLLNNDIIVTPGFLSPLVKTAQEKSNVACVGGVIYENDTERIWDAGGEMKPKRASKIRYHKKKSDSTYKTEFVTCAMNLLSREFIVEHNLDEGYFFGMEEVDLSWRATEQGWDMYINPRSVVYHKIGNSTDPDASNTGFLSLFQYYHKTRGHLRLASKNFPIGKKIIFYLHNIFLYGPYFFLLRILQGRYDISFIYVIAVKDYIMAAEPKKPEEF